MRRDSREIESDAANRAKRARVAKMPPFDRERVGVREMFARRVGRFSRDA